MVLPSNIVVTILPLSLHENKVKVTTLVVSAERPDFSVSACSAHLGGSCVSVSVCSYEQVEARDVGILFVPFEVGSVTKHGARMLGSQ